MDDNLPPAVNRYFAAATPAGIADCFAPDAIVEDERRTHRGRSEILAWREEVAKISFRQEILSVTQDADETRVTCQVTGDFPGSPVRLENRFRLDGDRITRLEIR